MRLWRFPPASSTVNAIVYSLCAEPELRPVEGAAPWPVLARQIPRMVVQTLNEAAGARQDRGVRYFPFLGKKDGKRGFLEFVDLLPLDAVCRVHGQEPAPQVVIDGLVRAEALELRAVEVATQKVRSKVEVPLDARDPWPAIQRLHFEITSLLGWSDAPPQRPAGLSGLALSWWLVARDEQLGLEASLIRTDSSGYLQGVREALRLAPTSPLVHASIVDLSRLLLEHRLLQAEVAQACFDAFTTCGDAALKVKMATLTEAAGDSDKAGALWGKLADERPVSVEAARRAAGFAFSAGDVERARVLVETALTEAPELDETGRIELWAQLLVFHEELGDLPARDSVADKMCDVAERRLHQQEEGLPASAARLLASVLVARDMAQRAERIASHAARGNPRHAGLWLEVGRARLAVGDPQGARRAFEQVRACDPTPQILSEARRLGEVGFDDDVLKALQEIERALAGGDFEVALRDAKQLCRKKPTLAEAWLLLGVARQRLDKMRGARRAFSRAIDLDPDCADAHNRLGILLAVNGRDRDALAHLSRAVELMPHEWGPRLHLAQVAGHLGNLDDARREFERARKLGAPDEKVDAALRIVGL